jgi:hypothetical protein
MANITYMLLDQLNFVLLLIFEALRLLQMLFQMDLQSSLPNLRGAHAMQAKDEP